jgi:hypothetical protein
MSQFPEGEYEYYAPTWKNKIDLLNQTFSPKDIAYDDTKDYLIEEKEIALKHPDTGSLIKLTDEGYIDIFAGPTTGIRIDPTTNSINFFGDNINIVSKQMNMVTKANGLSWNGYYFNPELYTETSTSKQQKLSGTKNNYVHSEEQGWHWERQSWSVSPMVANSSKRRYSEGMNTLMKDLGIPVE